MLITKRLKLLWNMIQCDHVATSKLAEIQDYVILKMIMMSNIRLITSRISLLRQTDMPGSRFGRL